MEYTGKYKIMNSASLGEEVSILEYASKEKIPYCTCDRCGKPIIRKMYVVQSRESGIEHLYLGAECIKQFN